MRTPDISVVVLVHNQSETHEIALHSLLNVKQCNENWEIIICDNGSYPKMINSVNWNNYLKSIPIKYIDCGLHNMSLSLSRNIGIKEAKSPIILCIDGDIILPMGLVQRHLERNQNKDKVIGGSRSWRSLDTDISPINSPEHNYNKLMEVQTSLDGVYRKREEDELFRSSIISQKATHLACSGFQLSFPKSSNSFFSTNITGWGLEDRDFLLRQFKEGKNEIIYDDKLKVLHLDSDKKSFNPFRNTNIKNSNVNQFLLNMVFVVESFKDICDINNLYYGIDRIKYNLKNDDWNIVSKEYKDSPFLRDKKYREIVTWLLCKGYLK